MIAAKWLLKTTESYCTFFRHCNTRSSVMRVLNVAEKNDAAKNIASLLSNGAAQRREGLSVYNKIYEFDCFLFNTNCKMIMTSVSGHLLSYEFASAFRGWNTCDPLRLFDAPVIKQCPPDYEKLKKTLEREIRSCSKLVIWTDCDREGENIGFEVIKVCTDVKPNIQVWRAKFSEITRQSVQRALANLVPPDKNVSDAVDTRMELDLRIGAAFTRYQTLHLKRMFPSSLGDSLISYGSCQFPTLGFVVERYKAICDFIAEQFWKIRVTDKRNEIEVEFLWKRVRLFDELACTVIYDICKEQPSATVEKVESKPKSKWRPRPLDTVEMEKLASRKLRISAKETMKIAEKLYTLGFISYPRTETNIFPKEMNLNSLVEQHVGDPSWGDFAQRVLQDGPNPFQGTKSDQAHPPIHPTKYTTQLSGREKTLYEFVVRHFLACLSKHAEGLETVVSIDIAGEKFSAKGLMIIARNYLDVYPYDKWSAKEMHLYREGDQFLPTGIEMIDGETQPPQALTEADLIALMDKHGIGTDATHAEHIETIKARFYVGLKDEKYFLPKTLGLGLVEGYDMMGFEMSKPKLRADLESDLKKICEGTKRAADVLADQIRKYRETFVETQRQVEKLDEALQARLQEQPVGSSRDPLPVSDFERVCPCSKCNQHLTLRSRREGGKFIGCEGYPGCREAIWIPTNVQDVQVSAATCPTCGPTTHLVKFKFAPGSCYLPPNYEGCIRGCDPILLNVLKGPDGPRSQSSTQISSSQTNHPRAENRPPPSRRTQPSSVSTDSGFESATGRSTQPSRTMQSTTDNDTIYCYCAKPTVRLTVRKDGPNQGRMFYKCDVPTGTRGCGFFQWADESDGNGGGSGGGTGPPPPPPPPPRGPSQPFREAGSNGGVLCNCSKPAVRLTVRKEGPNQNRMFYKCDVPPGTRGCDFFKWVDDNDGDEGEIGGGPDPPPPRAPPLRTLQSNGDSGEVNCSCSKPAVCLTVRKEGPNQGRRFYKCDVPPGTRGCDFFQWADDNMEDGNAQSFNVFDRESQRPSGSRGGYSANKRRGSFNQGQPKRRKCGICGEEGHNRKNCSQR